MNTCLTFCQFILWVGILLPLWGNARPSGADSRGLCVRTAGPLQTKLFLKPSSFKSDPQSFVLVRVENRSKPQLSTKKQEYSDLDCRATRVSSGEAYFCKGQTSKDEDLLVVLVKEGDGFKLVWNERKSDEDGFSRAVASGFQCDWAKLNLPSAPRPQIARAEAPERRRLVVVPEADEDESASTLTGREARGDSGEVSAEDGATDESEDSGDSYEGSLDEDVSSGQR